MRSTWALLLLALLTAGCPPEAPPQPPTETWTVRLRAPGDDPRAVVAAVVSIRECSPVVAKALVEGAAKRSLPVATGQTEAQAKAHAAALRRAGAKADAYPVTE